MTDSRLDSFVLLLNQPENNRDQLLMLLEEIHRKDDSGKSGR